ncbi:hypothetical protein [Sphingomonas sp. 28-63-12]|uniref:hypothetical protein n=1 Tax=Sphingomonas sp. 28-63-12 TaxID=1970434 RepID=UPI000BCF01BD|nr:MAG: hypothetical protein B7Y47_05060 [Sphingomonas sp. 28-63-12]
MDCWICGDPATTGEHRSKKSDLKAVLGRPTQADPMFLSTDRRRNHTIGSLDANRLKSGARLCASCNNARTQPHDFAWERVSDLVRTTLRRNETTEFLRLSRLVPFETRRTLLHVHLYFVKVFGCHIREADIPIDLAPFAAAILSGRAHAGVHLRFCRRETAGLPASVGMTDIWTAVGPGGRCAFATWFYEIDNLAVNVMFAEEGERREGLVGAWHPRLGTTKLQIFPYDRRGPTA